MGMMPITVSNFTQKYYKVNHKTTMQVKVKVLENVKRGKVQAIMGQPPNQLKANPTL
jgi:hypothetical protein